MSEKTNAQHRFAAMLAGEQVLIFLFAVSSGSGRWNSIQL